MKKILILLIVSFITRSTIYAQFDNLSVIHQDCRMSIFIETRDNQKVLTVVEFIDVLKRKVDSPTIRVAKYIVHEIKQEPSPTNAYKLELGAKQYLLYTKEHGEICEQTKTGLRCLKW